MNKKQAREIVYNALMQFCEDLVSSDIETKKLIDQAFNVLTKDDENFMSTEEAFQIVYELAEQNMLNGREVRQNLELRKEYDKQLLALKVFEDFAVNNIYN